MGVNEIKKCLLMLFIKSFYWNSSFLMNIFFLFILVVYDTDILDSRYDFLLKNLFQAMTFISLVVDHNVHDIYNTLTILNCLSDLHKFYLRDNQYLKNLNSYHH